MASANKSTFDMRELRRLALWGLAAAGALVLLVFAVSAQSGRDRLALASARSGEAAKPPPKAAPAVDLKEHQKLAETVRALTADRDRLLARISALEQNLQDVTGSIARATAAAREPSSPLPTVEPAATTSAGSAQSEPQSKEPAPAPTAAPAVAVAAPSAPPAIEPAKPEPAANAAPARTEFGADIGRAATIEGLRALWSSARSRHPSLLEGLRPIVYLREGDRQGRVEMRLIAGPIASAAAAARLCAALAAAGTACRPAVWDGQHLAMR
jgi:hypothetical protein